MEKPHHEGFFQKQILIRIPTYPFRLNTLAVKVIGPRIISGDHPSSIIHF